MSSITAQKTLNLIISSAFFDSLNNSSTISYLLAQEKIKYIIPIHDDELRKIEKIVKNIDADLSKKEFCKILLHNALVCNILKNIEKRESSRIKKMLDSLKHHHDNEFNLLLNDQNNSNQSLSQN